MTVRSLNVIRSRDSRLALHRVLELRSHIREIHILAKLDDDSWRYIASSVPSSADLIASTNLLRMYIEDHVREGMNSIISEEER